MNSGDTRPNPDPTVLTTQALLREMELLRELFTARLAHSDEARTLSLRVIETRLDGMDRLSESSIRDQKAAVAAALQAAKEAVEKQQEASDKAIAKSETAITKQMDQVVMLVQSGLKSVEVQLDDMKERVVRLESEKSGAASQIQQTQAASQTGSFATMAAVIGGLAAAGLGGGGIAALLMRH